MRQSDMVESYHIIIMVEKYFSETEKKATFAIQLYNISHSNMTGNFNFIVSLKFG